MGNDQINAIVPREVAGQSLTHIQIATPSGIIDGPSVRVRSAQPGTFPVVMNQDWTLNSQQKPARAGDIVTVYATGCSTASWANGQLVPVNAPNRSPLPVSVLAAYGDQALPLEVLYAGDAPGLVAGVTQINFRLPTEFSSFPLFYFTLRVDGILGQVAEVLVTP